jgi:hypothetical protein
VGHVLVATCVRFFSACGISLRFQPNHQSQVKSLGMGEKVSKRGECDSCFSYLGTFDLSYTGSVRVTFASAKQRKTEARVILTDVRGRFGEYLPATEMKWGDLIPLDHMQSIPRTLLVPK